MVREVSAMFVAMTTYTYKRSTETRIITEIGWKGIVHTVASTGQKLLPFCCQVELGQRSWSASHWATQNTQARWSALARQGLVTSFAHTRSHRLCRSPLDPSRTPEYHLQIQTRVADVITTDFMWLWLISSESNIVLQHLLYQKIINYLHPGKSIHACLL